MTDTAKHKWRFFRAGGVDQVRIETADDLRHLCELDQKLWMALSCPVNGLECDAKTLSFIDTDGDSKVRAPELLSAIDWALQRLDNPDVLLEGQDGLPIEAICNTDDEGKALAAAARSVLKSLGKESQHAITVADAAVAEHQYDLLRCNGDGVVPPEAVDDENLKQAVVDIMAIAGSADGRGALKGVSAEVLATFQTVSQNYLDWCAEGLANTKTIHVLGDDTAAAHMLYNSVADVVNGYFASCRTLAYHPAYQQQLDEKQQQMLVESSAQAATDALENMVLAAPAPSQPLPLNDRLNPHWQEPVQKLCALFKRDLHITDKLTKQQWLAMGEKLAPYATWQAQAGAFRAATNYTPERVTELRATSVPLLQEFITSDAARQTEAQAAASLEKLVRLARDLKEILENYVSFRAFYNADRKAVFQSGTLFIDGKSLSLCVRVDDPNKHAVVAALGRTHILYCKCMRDNGAETCFVAAAVTAGDAALIREGRNGVFYDRKGKDWDATVVKIIEHPIGLRQAFLSPYVTAGRLVGEQIEKFASARAKDMQSRMTTGLEKATKLPTGPSENKPFDAARFAGVFAAVGLAIGAIGTAAASVITGFLGLSWWQMPLAVFGLFMLISGPSMLVAAVKLRSRSLSPILDANGWAVNMRAAINIPFGLSLTKLASLPEGAERTLSDPFAKKTRLRVVVFVVIALGLLAFAGVQTNGFGLYDGKNQQQETAETQNK